MAMIVAVMGGFLRAAHKHTGARPSALKRILLPPACAYRAYLKHVGNKPSVGSGAQKKYAFSSLMRPRFAVDPGEAT